MIDDVLQDLKSHLIARMPGEVVILEALKSLGLVAPVEYEVSTRLRFKAFPVVRIYAMDTEQEQKFSRRKERYEHSVAIDILAENQDAALLERQLYNYMEAARRALYKYEQELVALGTIQSVQVTRHIYVSIDDKEKRRERFRRDVYLDVSLRETDVL
jgi:hypothetical protein